MRMTENAKEPKHWHSCWLSAQWMWALLSVSRATGPCTLAWPHKLVEVCCGTRDALKFATQTSQNDKYWTSRLLKQRRVWEARNGQCSEAP